jgi:pectate lyase
VRIVKVLIPALAFAALAVTLQADDRGDLGRQVLLPNDGWAAFGTGTTGGSTAGADQVYVVKNRRELVAALNNGVYPPPSSTPSNLPKIIYVSGTIDANVDDDNQPLSCTDYQRNGFTLEAFLAAYDPATWGRANPTGDLETARIASAAAQQARVRIRVGSNTTIVGIDRNATLRGAWLDVRRHSTAGGNPTNIIIRNLNFHDTYDCFPQWSPTDGAQGNWNAAYDSISLRDGDHIWVGNNSFADVTTADATLPTYFGRLFQVHDGLLDITNATDLVTVSWNQFLNHDKVMLIGSSDNAPADVGKLRVSLHHNLWAGTGQRTPRVRYGQVHVYNNLFRINSPAFQYAWGVGIQSAIYAEENFFDVDAGVTADSLLSRFNGTALFQQNNIFESPTEHYPVDLVAEYNATHDPDLANTVSWTPTLIDELHPARWVRRFVLGHSGPYNWQ